MANHFRALANELVRRGHRVVMLMHGAKRESDVEKHEGNPLILPWPSKRPTKLRDALFLYRLIQQHKPDCMISNFGASNLMMLLGKLMGVRCRVDWYHTLSAPIDMDARQPSWLRKLLKFRKRLVYKAASYVVAVSKAARQDLQQVYHVPDKKCHVFYNSLSDPLKQLNLFPKTNRQKKLISIGRLHLSKGQDVLIQALAYLKNDLSNVRVEFVGKGTSQELYTQLAERLGVSDKCAFIGALQRTELFNHLADSAATIVTSRSEAFGLVNIESLAVGTPVIASSVGGIVEIIRDGVDGFLFPPDDPKTLAEKLKELLSNADLRETMSRNAREHFLNTFEQSKLVREQADWFERIVA